MTIVDVDRHTHERHVEVDGGHSWTIRYGEYEAGTVRWETCHGCGYTEMHCEHTRNVWTAGGTRLVCVMCGADGT